jgi:vanillate O-demethylase ferredoxin subunit
METLDLVVVAVTPEAPNIRSLVLARPDGSPLPGWEAGAHIDLWLPTGDTRSYSLVNTCGELAATTNPASYRLAVRLEEKSKGGSAFMHALKPGDTVKASLPKNHFALSATDEEVVLVAGGIGITPIISMAARLSAQGKPYRLVYAGRSQAHLAFLDEISRLCGPRLHMHCDDLSGTCDLPALLKSLASQPLYVCGPTPMIDAAIAAAERLGWQQGRLHFEVFTAPAVIDGDAAFEVVLKQSGKRVQVPAGQTILDAVTAAGENPMSDCRRGDCGLCQAAVLEGIPDHRDYYLSSKERASNTLIQICVSRSKTPVLVLDL